MSISGASMPALTQPMTETGLTADDGAQLRSRGIPLAEAERQLRLLRTPPLAIVLDRPCAVGDGIVVLDAALRERLSVEGRRAAAAGRVTKFVPASGAATRMFKDLIAAVDGPDRPSSAPAVRTFFEQLDHFAFAGELRRRAGVTGELSGDLAADEALERRLLRTLLSEMRFADLPKGLIPFHRTVTGGSRTAFEEQLLEGLGYTRAADGRCAMHFTVSADFAALFDARLAEVRSSVETSHGPARLDVGFSVQQPSTDTLAIDAAGAPFRLAGGELLFRPAGHGALLANLQALDADLVVVKNIDNVLPDETNGEVVAWKQVLLGLLTALQDEVFTRLRAALSVDAADTSQEAGLRDTVAWIGTRFGRRPAGALTDAAACRAFIVDALDRPLRVCGVVRNEGEPGGAPFWVRSADGQVTVQIVESAQVHAADPAQRAVFASSTHFNPVDLACALRRHDGTPFDLARFVDEGTVFLSRKSHEGRELTALERPGLWNGAMAGWNTVCVEVPGSTFAPVKTVLDLLRPQHQPRA